MVGKEHSTFLSWWEVLVKMQNTGVFLKLSEIQEPFCKNLFFFFFTWDYGRKFKLYSS